MTAFQRRPARQVFLNRFYRLLTYSDDILGAGVKGENAINTQYFLKRPEIFDERRFMKREQTCA